jgi:chromosome partitioning protein
LGDEAALDAAEIVARPLIVMRNDHQDALSAGLAVCEHAPRGKSAEEMRALWQWVESRLGSTVTAIDEPVVEEFVEIPAIIPKWAALPSFDQDGAHFLRARARA